MWKSTYPDDFLLPGVKGLSLKSKNAKHVPSRPSSSRAPTTRPREPSIQPNKESPPPKVFSDPVRKSVAIEKKGDVVIHVFDENRNAKRDFYCRRQLLVSEMSYFAQHVQDKAPDEIVEIDVHCDVQVFEWLMAYISRKEVTLEPRTVISILISSNFLQMPSLETHCLSFVHKHINEVVQIPIDMRCIQSKIVQKLANLFSIDDLCQMEDPKDKLESQLYQFKMLDLMNNPSNPELVKCSLCARVLPETLLPRLSCDHATMALDKEGQLKCQHNVDPTFEINEYIVALFMSCQSWKRVYWRLWGTQNFLDCTICDQPFLCYEYSRCRRHLVYCSPEPGRGQYECCNQPCLKFMPFKPQHGCHYFTHVPKTSGGTVYSLFQKNKHHILWKTEAELETMSPVAVKLDILALSQRLFFNKWAKAESIHRGGFPDPLFARDRPMTASSKSLSQFDQRRKDADDMKGLSQQLLQLRANVLAGSPSLHESQNVSFASF